MLGFMGVGAISVLQAHTRQQRYISYEREARHARNMGMRQVYADAVRSEGLKVEDEEWEAFSCFYLCMNCGYLGDDSAVPCPGCGAQSWMDLRNVGIAEEVRAMENRERQLIPVGVKKRGRLAGMVFGLVAGGASSALAWSIGRSWEAVGVWGAVVLILATLAGWVGFTYLFNYLHFSKRRRYPIRWQLPLPMPQQDATPARTLTGKVQARGELLEAPISGRPCVGYEVSVLFDVAGDKRPPMWVLEEERSIAFEIDGETIEANGATVEIPSTIVGGDEELGDGGREDATRKDATSGEGFDKGEGPSGEGFDKGEGPTGEGPTEEELNKKMGLFLRKRGLFLSEGFFTLFEALIEPGKDYEVRLHEDPPGAAAEVFPAE